MKDREFERLIKRTRKAFNTYKTLLDQAEQEYERRFTNNPSEVDDDYWIDTLHYGQGSINIEKILKSAKMHNKMSSIPSSRIHKHK